MENFSVNEYFKDYAAINKEYFSDLKQVTEPTLVGGRLESQVLFNGEGYKKIEHITDDSIYILLVPNENLQVLPVVEIAATSEHIHIDTFKLINKLALEHTTYISSFRKDDDIAAELETKYFDVSDEIHNDRYVLKYRMLLELGKEIDKKLIGSNSIIAKRDRKVTIYASEREGNLIEPVTIFNEGTSLFELLKGLDKLMKQKNKTK